jgi:hypothetical protein
MIKSRRMRWAGHVARVRNNKNVYRVLVGKPEWKRPLERLIRVRIILKSILETQNGVVWNRLI